MEPDIMMDVLHVTGICPILASAEDDMAVPAAQALVEGGLPVIEVLLRSDNALDNIRRIAKGVPEVIVGAGTVRTLDDAKRAVDAGARFLIMPGFAEKTVRFCLDQKIPVVPGCVTCAEIATALEYGLTTVKFFPVYELGGVPVLEHLGGTFPMVRFVVTGMLNETNFLPLLKNASVLACGGDWMFTQGNALVCRDYALISKNLRNSVYRAQDLRSQRKAAGNGR